MASSTVVPTTICRCSAIAVNRKSPGLSKGRKPIGDGRARFLGIAGPTQGGQQFQLERTTRRKPDSRGRGDCKFVGNQGMQTFAALESLPRRIAALSLSSMRMDLNDADTFLREATRRMIEELRPRLHCRRCRRPPDEQVLSRAWSRESELGAELNPLVSKKEITPAGDRTTRYGPLLQANAYVRQLLNASAKTFLEKSGYQWQRSPHPPGGE